MSREKPDRLLEYIIGTVPNTKRIQAKKWLQTQSVTVNGIAQSRFDFQLQAYDKICVKSLKHAIPVSTFAERAFIAYDDEDLAIAVLPGKATPFEINRNSTLKNEAGHPAAFQTKLIESLLTRKNRNKPKLFPIQKFDESMSGLYICAKNLETKNSLKKEWNAAGKIFTCICEGNFKTLAGCIRTSLNTTCDVVVVSPISIDGGAAVSNYRILDSVLLGNRTYSLVEVSLDTDYRDQIRAHMANIGHPILGDSKYNSLSNPQENCLRRLALHFSKVRLMHPTRKQWLTFEAPLPVDFESFFSGDFSRKNKIQDSQNVLGVGVDIRSNDVDTTQGQSREVRILSIHDFLRGK